MKFRKTLFALLAICFLALTGCNSIDEKGVDSPSPAAKTIPTEHDYYSLNPQSTTSVFKMHVTHNADGSVDIARSVVPASSDYSYSDFVVEGAAANMQAIGGAYEVGFGSNGWNIPFDPSEPVSSIAGAWTTIHCDCYGGYGECGVGTVTIHSNGAGTFSCRGSCIETCIRRVEQGSGISSQSSGSVFLQASILNY